MKWFVQGWMRKPFNSPRDGETAAQGQSGVLGVALWLGIIVGLVEVGGLIAVRKVTGTITYTTLRTNWHYGWMIPVSYVILFGTVGLLLLGLGRLRPGLLGFRTSAFVLAFLTALAAALAIPRVHGSAIFLLAVGTAAWLGPWLGARWCGVTRFARRTLPGAVTVFAVWVSWHWYTVAGAERRVLESLPRAAAGAPNVLLIVLDTVRFDGVFPTPPASDPTPYLTRLASRGIRFDEARSTAPWTLPSHASMFTGRWPHELSTGVGRPLDTTYPTLAEHLARQGYAPAAFMGNTHNGNAWYGLDRGFSRYEDHYENTMVTGLELSRSSRLGSAFLVSKVGRCVVKAITKPPKYNYRKSAAMINRSALAWIDAHRDRPFFAVLNYYDAHDPYEPPAGAPRPFSTLHASDSGRSVAERARDAYDDCLAYLDSQLERLFADLEGRGILKNTVVIVTSDHGEAFGEHRLQGHGLSLYRQELHVPLVVVLPTGFGAGQRVAHPVSLRDLPATIAELTRTAQASPFPGGSLSRYWSSRDPAGAHDPFLSEVDAAIRFNPEHAHAPSSRGAVKAVFAHGHVFIRDSNGNEELYDLDDDMHETDNRIDEANQDPPLHHFRSTLERLLSESAKRAIRL